MRFARKQKWRDLSMTQRALLPGTSPCTESVERMRMRISLLLFFLCGGANACEWLNPCQQFTTVRHTSKLQDTFATGPVKSINEPYELPISQQAQLGLAQVRKGVVPILCVEACRKGRGIGIKAGCRTFFQGAVRWGLAWVAENNIP